jgi:predicted transcriptional regulator
MSVSERNRRLDLRKAPGIKARDFVLLALFEAGKNGISAKDLQDKADVSRDTVYDECRKLEMEGLVTRKTKGKRTTYYAEPKIFNELFLYSWVFGNEIFSKINSNVMITSDLKSNTLFENSQYYTTKFAAKDDVERFLFEFSVRIGAIIMYLLIQAMSSDMIYHLTYSNKVPERIVIDHIIESWVKNVISPAKMLHLLRNSIGEPGYHLNFDEMKRFTTTSSFQLTDKIIQRFSKAFERVYPNLHTELDRVKKNLPKKIETMRKQMEQLRCHHDYHKSTLKNETRLECSKCKLMKKVKTSDIETNDETIEKLNKLKPLNKIRCDEHCWIRDKKYDRIYRSIVYQCLLCNEAIRFYTEEKKILDKIDDVVQRELGFKYVPLCNKMELYFYHHRNQNVTIRNLMELYRELDEDYQDQEDLVYNISAILDILIKYGYIEEIDPSAGNLYERMCERTKKSIFVGI